MKKYKFRHTNVFIKFTQAQRIHQEIKPTLVSFLNPKLLSFYGWRSWGLYCPHKRRMRLRSVACPIQCVPGYVWAPRRWLLWSQTHLNFKLKTFHLVFLWLLGKSMWRMLQNILPCVYTHICAYTYIGDQMVEPPWTLSLRAFCSLPLKRAHFLLS